MDINLLKPDERIDAVFDVMRELRPQYDRAALAEQIAKQQRNGYQVVYVQQEGQVLAVAGFVVSEKLAWRKHVYIDDLVTSEAARSTGVGRVLMDWFKNYCKANQCEQLHLDSGVQRFRAHRFYLREGFDISSHHFQITELD